MWLSKTTAVDGGLAWPFIKGGSLHMHSDHLWHTFDALKTDYTIPVYFGIDIFVVVAPVMDIIPATQLRLNGGIGARFFL